MSMCMLAALMPASQIGRRGVLAAAASGAAQQTPQRARGAQHTCTACWHVGCEVHEGGQ